MTAVASNNVSSAPFQWWLVPGVLCAESALFLALATQRIDQPSYLILHLGSCAATAVFGVWWAAASPPATATDRAVLILHLVAWTTLAGPFGAFIASGISIGITIGPRPHGGEASAGATAPPNVADRPDAAVSRLELLHHALLDRRLRLGQAHRIRPLLDVILDGTQMEKFDALSLISKRYAPAVAPALKRVLEDKDGSVRVLAATVMARQHNGYTRRIGECQAIARATPDDPNGWSALARAHLDYVGSGLLEESRAETERAQARIHLDRSERLCRGDVASRLEAQTPRETGDTA